MTKATETVPSHFCEYVARSTVPCSSEATTTRGASPRLVWNFCAEHAAAWDQQGETVGAEDTAYDRLARLRGAKRARFR